MGAGTVGYNEVVTIKPCIVGKCVIIPKVNASIHAVGDVVGGVGTLALIGDNLEDFFIYNPQINIGTAVFATFLLIGFGAIAGYIPAKRAARIKPIVALRDE